MRTGDEMNTLEYKKICTVEEAIEADLKIFRAIENYRLQSLDNLGVSVIVDRLNLEPFLEFLIEFNSGNDLPYHNFYHSICVFLNCYEGAMHSSLEVSGEEVRGLCAGALLHDFNHSGGMLPDVENIKKALDGLATAQKYASSKHLGLSSRSLEIAIEAIKITQFPFEREPLSIIERIIRDADMMQPYEESPALLLKQYLGLKAEIELQRGITYTLSDFAKGVREFQGLIPWHTQWAHEKEKFRSFEFIKSHLEKLISESL